MYFRFNFNLRFYWKIIREQFTMKAASPRTMRRSHYNFSKVDEISNIVKKIVPENAVD